MAGMLQILTYLLAFYLVVKAVGILQIGLASSRNDRTAPIMVGVITLIFCIAGAIVFVRMQNEQAVALAQMMPTR